MGDICLNLGSGSMPEDGYVNVDIADVLGVDMVWDLDKAPWPWPDRSVSRIRAYDVFEHVEQPLVFMTECWRVMKTGALLDLHVSYWKSENAYTDPTHKRFCTEHTFDFWVPGTELHNRYGAAYAGQAEFDMEQAYRDGQELAFVLRRCN